MPPFHPQQQSNPTVHWAGSLGASVLWLCVQTGADLASVVCLAYDYLFHCQHNARVRVFALCASH
jgi:hypothetical protein